MVIDAELAAAAAAPDMEFALRVLTVFNGAKLSGVAPEI